MKVALVSPYDLTVPGGVQSHVLHLAEQLRRAGDQVVVVGPGDGDGHLGVGGSIRMRFNGSVAPIGLTGAAHRNTRRALQALGADVVHVHEPMVPLVGWAAATHGAAPTVATFHAWSDRVRAYRTLRPMGRRVLRHLDEALAVSPAAAGYHARALGVDRSHFTIAPNGVDVARFANATPDPALADPDGPTLLFVGRFEPRKGLEPLLRGFVSLAERHPQVRLLVVGDGPQAERCRSLVPEPLRNNVRFLGRVSDEDLAACYASADLFVAPALGGESFGIVLLEAMAAGCAIVASDIPGYRSVLQEGREGCFAPPGDPGALADVLASLVADPDRVAAMSRRGRSTAADYDWPVLTAQVRAIYQRAIAG